jgi:hypothetical protein
MNMKMCKNIDTDRDTDRVIDMDTDTDTVMDMDSETDRKTDMVNVILIIL